MPIKKSAKKSLRRSLKNYAVNLQFKIAMKKSVKNYLKMLQAGDTEKAQSLLSGVYKAIDKAAKRGVIKKQTAARKKSRLTKKLA